MTQTSKKQTNKNTIRSGKTTNSSKSDIDHYLDDLNEPDEPVSKTRSSKHDGTITPKSIKVVAPTSTGKSLQVLNKDGQRANKAQRLTKAAAGKPSTTSKQQRKPVDSIGSIDKPVLTGSDKLHFSVPVSKLQLARAIEVALLTVKLKEKPLTHRSVKGEWFRHKFVYTFGSHTYAVPCQAVLKMKSTKQDATLDMEVDLNPNNLTVSEVGEWLALWKELFGTHARELAQQIGIMRLDNNADCPYRTDDLIIDLDGARMGEKYYVRTTAGAMIQSNYAGNAKAAERLSVYDKEGSEAYKEAQARAIDCHQEEAHEDDALIRLKRVAGGERTRAEIRRVFEGHHPKVSELGKIADPFGHVRVYHIDRTKTKHMSVEFIAFLDSVRVRGVNGAGRYLIKECGNTKEAKSKVQEFERQLARLAAPWWPPEDFNASALDLLKSLPIWKFLRPRKVK
nr:hypothetical protein [Rhodoferax sp.]